MEKTFFYNFFPSKAEEDALKATNSKHKVTRTLVEINSIYPPPVIDYTNPWQIRKHLINGEVATNKIVMGFAETFGHVFRYWTMEMANDAAILSKRVKVVVWDVTDRDNPKRYQGDDVYVMRLQNDDYAICCYGLFKDRGLNVGDGIGIFWDPRASNFQFTVLHRAVVSVGTSGRAP